MSKQTGLFVIAAALAVPAGVWAEEAPPPIEPALLAPPEAPPTDLPVYPVAGPTIDPRPPVEPPQTQAVVPEPMSLALLGGGAALLAAARRRRRRRP